MPIVPINNVKDAFNNVYELLHKLKLSTGKARPVFQGIDQAELRKAIDYLYDAQHWKNANATLKMNRNDYDLALQGLQKLHGLLKSLDLKKLAEFAKLPPPDQTLTDLIDHINGLDLIKFTAEKEAIELAILAIPVRTTLEVDIRVLNERKRRLAALPSLNAADTAELAAIPGNIATKMAALADAEAAWQKQWEALETLTQKVISVKLVAAIEKDTFIATDKKPPEKKPKGIIKLVRIPGQVTKETIVDDDRYSKIAGKDSPQAKRRLRADKVYEKDTNFGNFHSSVADGFNQLGQHAPHGLRAGTRSPEEGGYVKGDKERAYVNTKLQATVEGKGTDKERVVVTVETEPGKREEILHVKKDSLICKPDLITILSPSERAKLTGADAIKAAAPSIADGFREMLQNAGKEYDVRFAIASLVNDADQDIDPRPGNIDDAKLLIDLARNAFIAGAVPILGAKELACIKNLEARDTGPYKVFAQHILAIDELVYGKGPRVDFSKVTNEKAKEGMDKFKELFNIGAPRNITTRDISSPDEGFAVIELADLKPADLDHGRELVARAKEALKLGDIPVLSDQQLACIDNLHAKGSDAEKAEAAKILKIDAVVYGAAGAARREQKDVTSAQHDAGLQEARTLNLVSAAVLTTRMKGVTSTKPYIPSKPKAPPKSTVSLTSAEEAQIKQALVAKGFPSSLTVDKQEAFIADIIDNFNRALNKPGVTKDNRDDVIKFCCDEAKIPNITVPAAPPKPPVSLSVEEEQQIKDTIIAQQKSVSEDMGLTFELNAAESMAAKVIEKFNLALNKPGADRKATIELMCDTCGIDHITTPAVPPKPTGEIKVEAVLTKDEEEAIRKNLTEAGNTTVEVCIDEIKRMLKAAAQKDDFDRVKFFEERTEHYFGVGKANPNKVIDIAKKPVVKLVTPPTPAGVVGDMTKYDKMLSARLPKGAVMNAVNSDIKKGVLKEELVGPWLEGVYGKLKADRDQKLDKVRLTEMLNDGVTFKQAANYFSIKDVANEKELVNHEHFKV